MGISHKRKDKKMKDQVAAAPATRRLAREMGISLEQVAFVGNDLNDLACLEAVGLPIVVRDAHPDVIPGASYRTSAPGGHGAVREICDLFARVIATERG